jgi:hypothetical protein
MISSSVTTAEVGHRHNGRATDWPPEKPLVGTYVECRMCGFEPAEQLLLPRGPCPKCGSDTWRRSLRPGTLLAEACEGRSPESAGRTEGDDDVLGLAHRHGQAWL